MIGNLKIYRRLHFLVAVTVLLITSCKTIQDYHRPRSITIPGQASSDVDTTSTSDVPWDDLFGDAYLQLLIDTALKNNWDIQAALQRTEVTRANYQQTSSSLIPGASGVVSAGAERLSDNSFNKINNASGNKMTDIFVGIQSSWEIDLWNRLKNTRKSAYQRFLSSEQGVRFLQTNIVAEIAQRYYRLHTLDTILAIFDKNIALQQKAVEVIAIQKLGGRATELAVQQFKAQLLNTQSLELDYRQQLIENENELNALLGRFQGQIVRHKDLKPSFQNLQQGVPTLLLLRRPDVRQAELELSAFETDIKVARAAFFPALTISPYVGVNALTPVKLANPGSFVFGMFGGLTAPLFNWIAIKGNFNRSKAAAYQSFYNYQRVITNSYKEVLNNISSIKNLIEMYSFKAEQTETLEGAVNIAQDLYLAGYANYLEVIRSQESVLTAELELADTRNRIYQSKIDLYRSLGGGWK